jgi:predicted transglutaminase-like cysteine proteinase
MLCSPHRIGWLCRIGAILILLGLCAQTALNEPFGLATVAAAPHDRWSAIWMRLGYDIAADLAAVARCRTESVSCGSPAAQRFIGLVDHGAPYQGFDRIRHINRAVNLTLRIREQPAWTSPLAALAAGEGDCKQYAAIKYAAMLDGGFAPDDVRLIVGSIPPGTGHAVVAVRSAGIWFILDNRSLDVVRSEAFAAFTPLYAFDSRGVRRFAPPVAELPGQPCAG